MAADRPADPVVSPADTIRRELYSYGNLDAEQVTLRREDVVALLAVGERDSAPEIGPVPTDAGGPGKEETYWLTQKLKASIRHLRDIEDYYRPRSDRLGSYNEQRADRARVLYEQITADFLHGKLLVLPEIVALREAGERDRQHIAQLTAAIERYIAADEANEEAIAELLLSDPGEDYSQADTARALDEAFAGLRAVLADKEDAELRPEDLKIDTYNAGAEYGVRVTHLPTGYVGTSDSHASSLAAKDEALTRLRAKIRAAGEGDT